MSVSADQARRSALDRVRSILLDIRALGVGAPLRAGYEASKRFGGHTVVFGHLVSASGDVAHARSPFENREVPNAVRDRTLAAADRISAGTIEIFGRELRLGDPPDWHAVIHAGGSWPAVDWWKIDLRSDGRTGDVKWAWELGRHRHLVLLARAVHLDPSDDHFMEALSRHLESWMRLNPPEIGVHWYSNLEISLRALAWLQILALVGDDLDPELRAGMWSHLHHSGRHLVADLPYTVSTMRNNHLLGDGLGLIALGKAFGGRVGRRWVSIGIRIFDRQLARHMRADGSMIEDSVSYHRFVLEMLAMRVILGGASDDVREAMESAAQFFARLGVLDGPVPQYGDWDEGRVFSTARDAVSLEASVLLALALAGTGAPEVWRSDYDEVAWLVDEGLPSTPDSAVSDGRDLGASIARVSEGPMSVWLKGGSAPSHGHADLSSVAIAYGGSWIIGDPGTGTYNGPLEERNYFKTSVSHNVARIDGEDQLVPHRAFRWLHQASGAIGEPIRFNDTVVMWAVHGAYTRLSPPRRVVRVVSVSSESVEVIDHVEGPPVSVSISLPLHPNASWDEASSIISCEGHAFKISLPEGKRWSARGLARPYSGWWSETYGTAEPATLIQIECDPAQAIRWTIREVDWSESDGPLKPPPVLASAVQFDEGGARLRLRFDGETFSRNVSA